MTNSNIKQISFTAPTEEVEEWEERADHQDLSRSAWARQRIRTGMRLWDATGDFNQDQFEQVFQGEQNSTTASSSGDSAKSQVKELIKRNLSVTEPVAQAELKDVIIEVMNEALYELQQDREVEHVPGEGYRQLRNNE